MSFSEKISVLEIVLELLKKNETQLETLIEKMEIINQTIQNDPILSKSVKEFNSSPSEESIVQRARIAEVNLQSSKRMPDSAHVF